MEAKHNPQILWIFQTPESQRGRGEKERLGQNDALVIFSIGSVTVTIKE